MAMVYQAGLVYEKGARIKKWYGQFRVYQQDQQGKEVRKNKKVILGLKSQLRKHEAEEKLRGIIRQHNSTTPAERTILPPDDSVTFDWFVKEKYLPLRRGRWSAATKEKTEYEINHYLVGRLRGIALRNVDLFKLQTLLNNLAERFSESIVKHAFVNLRSIMKVAKKLKVLADNPGEDLEMPVTRPVEKPTITAGQINGLLDAIKDLHDKCLMAIGLFCALRTSETFGLRWKAYQGDRIVIETTAYEGRLYARVKTEASRSAVPVPEDIRPFIEAWKRKCPDTSPEALMFSTFGRGERTGKKVPRHAKNFLKWRIYPITDKLEIPRKLVTFQVMRRTLGTDLQEHGTMKDAQAALRHASIKTTANVYMQPIPASVTAALNSRTRAVLAKKRQDSGKTSEAMLPNAPQFPDGGFANA
ncbi:MAG TPA: site-specific integrase [Terriglobales bacterium]|nr:site-specific integrase [Terriglobales bacterium]